MADMNMTEEQFIFDLVATLLNGMDATVDQGTRAALLKGCAVAHYKVLKMDVVLAEYQGRVEEFCQFLSTNWNWKVSYDKTTQVIIADENKNECVCPLVKRQIVKDSGTLCSCSEGFAEKMFTTVIGKPVNATVVQSILRGAPSCVYRIQIL